MTGTEMLEKLGYENRKSFFEDNRFYNEDLEKCIEFLTIGKNVIIRNGDSLFSINMETLKAIHQKCKELGWLDE